MRPSNGSTATIFAPGIRGRPALPISCASPKTRWCCWRTSAPQCTVPRKVDMTANSEDLAGRAALKLIAGGLGLAALGGPGACAPATSTASSSALAQPRPSPGPAPERFLAAPPMDTVRIGFVGVGGQGTAHVRNLLRGEGCGIKAVDDIGPEKVTKTHDLMEQAGLPPPTGYSLRATDFVRM